MFLRWFLFWCGAVARAFTSILAMVWWQQLVRQEYLTKKVSLCAVSNKERMCWFFLLLCSTQLVVWLLPYIHVYIHYHCNAAIFFLFFFYGIRCSRFIIFFCSIDISIREHIELSFKYICINTYIEHQHQ